MSLAEKWATMPEQFTTEQICLRLKLKTMDRIQAIKDEYKFLTVTQIVNDLIEAGLDTLQKDS